MTTSAFFDETANTLRLKGCCSMLIQDLEDLRGLVLSGLPRGGRVEFDLSDVAEIDSAGLQFLVAVKKKVELDGGSFVLSGLSIPVINLLKIYGLAGQFEIGEGA